MWFHKFFIFGQYPFAGEHCYNLNMKISNKFIEDAVKLNYFITIERTEIAYMKYKSRLH
jgi:hypothetical protein